jgi:molecular chaperone DnaK
MPQIEVTFDIDANGILHVSAKDKATGKENKIKIQASSGLSEAEIAKMVQDAEMYAEDDKKTIELVTARNQLDALIHATNKSMKEYGEQLSAEEKTSIETAVKEAEEAVKGDDKDAINAKTEALSTSAHKLSEKLQAAEAAKAQAAGGADAGAAQGEAKHDDADVVDAEFTEVKNDKK